MRPGTTLERALTAVAMGMAAAPERRQSPAATAGPRLPKPPGGDEAPDMARNHKRQANIYLCSWMQSTNAIKRANVDFPFCTREFMSCDFH
eukprot:1917966-Pleurochrysis_carterae.AAC.5